MKITYNIHQQFLKAKAFLNDSIKNFETKGIPFGDQDRNSLKLFDFEGIIINMKSFKVPNLINQIAYKFFRKSKAQRSFEYATKLTSIGIGTPQPIAYYEFSSLFLFKKSYYISKQLDCDLTYRELTANLDHPEHETILRAFTRFTFKLHEKGIHFLDHSPGNTLIKKENNTYAFYLVDLNRMRFETMSFNKRIKNFAKLTIHKSMIEIMSDEYAKLTNTNYNLVFNLMWKETQDFQATFWRRRRLKKKLKFWKKIG